MEGACDNECGSVLSNSGHAVYVNSSPVKWLEKTVPASKALDSSVDGEAGGWTEQRYQYAPR
jgi:hypothetical protein